MGKRQCATFLQGQVADEFARPVMSLRKGSICEEDFPVQDSSTYALLQNSR